MSVLELYHSCAQATPQTRPPVFSDIYTAARGLPVEPKFIDTQGYGLISSCDILTLLASQPIVFLVEKSIAHFAKDVTRASSATKEILASSNCCPHIFECIQEIYTSSQSVGVALSHSSTSI